MMSHVKKKKLKLEEVRSERFYKEEKRKCFKGQMEVHVFVDFYFFMRGGVGC